MRKILSVDLFIHLGTLAAYRCHVENDHASLHFLARFVTDLLQFFRCSIEFSEVTRNKHDVEALPGQMSGAILANAVGAACDDRPGTMSIPFGCALHPKAGAVED